MASLLPNIQAPAGSSGMPGTQAAPPQAPPPNNGGNSGGGGGWFSTPEPTGDSLEDHQQRLDSKMQSTIDDIQRKTVRLASMMTWFCLMENYDF